jgi:hypothetical protein
MIPREYYYVHGDITISGDPKEETERRNRRRNRDQGHESNVAIPNRGQFDSANTRENIKGFERLETADGYSSRTGDMIAAASNSKPLIKAKWRDRNGESIARTKSAGVVKGDRELERMLSSPKWANSYLVSYNLLQKNNNNIFLFFIIIIILFYFLF